MNPERIDALTEIISASFEDLQQTSEKPDSDIDLLSGIDHVENIAFAAQMVEMECLEEICHEINRVLFDPPSENSHSPAQRIKILVAWTKHVLAFLRKPTDPELAEKITSFLSKDLQNHYTQRLLNRDQAPAPSDSSLTPPALEPAQALEPDTEAAQPALMLVANATTDLDSQTSEPANENNSDQQCELMEVFLIELTEVQAQLDESFKQMIQAPSSEPLTATKDTCITLIQRIKETATLVNLLGVTQVCLFIEENINHLNSENIPNDTQALATVFNQWIPLTENYLRQTNDDEAVFDLINHLELDTWPHALKEHEAQRMLTLLVNYRATNSSSLAFETTPSVADIKDVAVDVADDASSEIVDIYISELPQQTQALSKAISDINLDRDRLDNIRFAQRLAHTLKGSSNLIGVRGIANLSHYLEELFISLTRQNSELNDTVKHLLEETCDGIEDMADLLIANPRGNTVEHTNAGPHHQALLQKVLDFINNKPTEKNDQASSQTNTITNKALPDGLNADVEPNLNEEDLSKENLSEENTVEPAKVSPLTNIKTHTNTLTEPTQQSNQPSKQSSNQSSNQSSKQQATQPSQPEPEETLRVPVKILDSLFSLVEELTVQMGTTHDKIKQLVKTKNELKKQDDRIQERRFELENIVDVRGIDVRGAKALHTSPSIIPQPSNTSQSQDEEFDRLEMDQFSEVHDATHSYIESVADAREISASLQEQLVALDTLFIQQRRINKELQRQLKNTRLVPISSIESRLQRCVRHACRITGKQTTLSLSGGDTMINDDILNKLVDPLMHVLRNAVDHGIESAEHRLNHNKPSVGRIEVSVSQRGQNIFIACQDDGAGINLDTVLKSAQKKGFINQKSQLNNQQLVELLIQPGFSTRDQATQVSGRGVGMDAVNIAVQGLNGELHLSSEEHFGTMVTFSIPIKLLATHALIIQSHKQRFAVPSRSISQIIPPGVSEIKMIGEKPHLEFNQELYEAYNLDFLLDSAQDPKGSDELWNQSTVLLIKSNQRHIAIRIDTALSSQELVIKSTGKYVQDVPGCVGVAVMGDGALVTLLDINGLLQTRQHIHSSGPSTINTHNAENDSDTSSNAAHGNNVLIVDDSLSVRRSLGQMMEDAGYKPILARDGLDAVEQLKNNHADLMLVDLEMPRMNGIELTRHLRNSKQHNATPIFMITSRSTSKHRNLAAHEGVTEYFTKPYTESDLLSKIHQHLHSQVESQ